MIFGGVSIMKLTMTQSTASLGIPDGYRLCDSADFRRPDFRLWYSEYH